MGSLRTRSTHGRRLLQKQRGVRRQVRIAKSKGMDVSEPHRFAKHNAIDCGNPKCPMCGNPRHSGYVKDRLTVQEKKFRDEDEGYYEYD